MSNCTQTLLIATLDKKQQILDKIQEMFLKASPYIMDNWGLYPTHAEYVKFDKENIRIGYIETHDRFMIRASHPNCFPNWYLEFAKSIGAKLLFQDLDGYGEEITWDVADTSTTMSNIEHTDEINRWYHKYIPFTREFLGLPKLEVSI